MGLFSSRQNKTRYGALIDIGSGSVLVAIVASSYDSPFPEIIWSKRVYAPLRKTDSVAQSAKNVMTSLLNALMLLDSEGRTVLREKYKVNSLLDTQVTIAAPWAYTVTKNISYNHKEEFTISDELVNELLRTAHKKVKEELNENERVTKLGLVVIVRSITGLLANGYSVAVSSRQQAKTLQIVESSAIAQEYLIKALDDGCAKVLPRTDLKLYSFILIYYYVLRELEPDTLEYCLIDITYEATEIGIVRDGVLNYSTHTSYGAFSLAREFAQVLKVPLEEAYSYMHQPNLDEKLSSYSAAQKADIEKICAAYQERLTALFHETGDSLSIPKKIFLHGNLETEPFFRNQITLASKLATKSSHAVYPVSEAVLTQHYPEEAKTAFTKVKQDTALLISAQFFHTQAGAGKFEQV